MTIEYIMVAALTANPTQHVYWAALNDPDYDGIFSGYSAGELILPAVVDYTLTTPIVGTGNVSVQGLASGDLSGVYPAPIVTGLQGRRISPMPPTDGSPLVWDASLQEWIAGPASGGGSLLPPLSFQQFAALIENPGGNPVFSRLTQDMILPSFTVSLAGGTFAQVGQTITHPNFTAVYNQTPISAILTDTDGNTQNVSSTPTSFTSVNSYVKNSFGATTTFTLTANNNIVNKTATTAYEWVQLSFYGTGAAGGNSAAFIQALTHQFLTASRGTNFTITAGAGQYIYFACRSAYGTPIFSVGGFVGGFNLISNTISVTNAYGFTENYQLWISDNADLGSTTVAVQ